MEQNEQSVVQAASWRLASDLVRRHPDTLLVTHTEPAGGTYDCLKVWTGSDRPGRIELNRNGRIHVHQRFDDAVEAETEPITWAEYLDTELLPFIEQLERSAGLDTPDAEQALTAQSLTIQVLATIAATGFKAEALIEIRPGQLDSSAYGAGPNPDLDLFGAIPQDLLRPRPDDLHAAAGYRFWVVGRKGEPVLAIERDAALAWTRHGETIDLRLAYERSGGDVATVAFELLLAVNRPPSVASGSLDWDDPALAVASDPPLRRRYRALQNHHRHHVLGALHGKGGNGRPVGSMLDDDAVAIDPGLNFFGDQDIVDYVKKRVPQVRADGGSLDEHRLRHNLLSSMPMAFSIAAKLRSAPDRAEILRGAFGLEIGEIESIEAEWAPLPATSYLDDRSAFDIVVRFRTPGDLPAVLGIETKYTEPLSMKEYDKERYREVTRDCGWFEPGAADHLVGRKTNQLWRNAMLAASMVLAGDVAVAHLGIVGLEADAELWASVDALDAHLVADAAIRAVTWESLIASLPGTSLESFGADFRSRYLDASVLDR